MGFQSQAIPIASFCEKKKKKKKVLHLCIACCNQILVVSLLQLAVYWDSFYVKVSIQFFHSVSRIRSWGYKYSSR